MHPPEQLARRIEQTPEENFAQGLLFGDLTGVPAEYLHSGKVRDIYRSDGKLLLCASDRVSTFDVVVGSITGKGAALTLTSAWWMERTRHVIPNHLLAVPHPNVTIVEQAEKTLPIEFVVRGYLAESSSSTSVWSNYARGDRVIYGINFPDGLRPNQQFTEPIITPTTKAQSGHDQMLTDEQAHQIADNALGWGTWDILCEKAKMLFEVGSRICLNRGLVLADSKYEFALLNGELGLIDELFTPDSSRFWLANTYQELFEQGKPPERFDKEILRAWLAGSPRGYKGAGPVPIIDQTVKDQMSVAYTVPYQMITGAELPVADTSPETMQQAVQEGLAALQQ